MRNLAVRICNVVATLDYSHIYFNLNLCNLNVTIYKVGGGSVCHVVVIRRVDRRLATSKCELAEEEPLRSPSKDSKVDVVYHDARLG
jgi:hypothetical protein